MHKKLVSYHEEYLKKQKKNPKPLGPTDSQYTPKRAVPAPAAEPSAAPIEATSNSGKNSDSDRSEPVTAAARGSADLGVGSDKERENLARNPVEGTAHKEDTDTDPVGCVSAKITETSSSQVL